MDEAEIIHIHISGILLQQGMSPQSHVEMLKMKEDPGCVSISAPMETPWQG